MILHSVPDEDPEDDGDVDASPQSFEEDASLYGRTMSGSGLHSKKPEKTKRVKKKGADLDGSQTPSLRPVVLGLLCFFGALGIAAVLAVVISLMSRYAAENEGDSAERGGYVVAMFSYGNASTSAGLAWLAAALITGMNNISVALSGQRPNAVGVFSPTQGTGTGTDIWKIWRPRNVSAFHHMFAHGSVVKQIKYLRQGLIKNSIQDLSKTTGSGNQKTPEADAFLEMRELQPQAGERVVLLSHPHHLPLLYLLARSSGFEVMVIDPTVYEVIPWSTFGCNSFGYPRGVHPKDGLSLERKRFESYVQELKQDWGQYSRVKPMVEAANASLAFHWCMANADLLELFSSASEACRESIAAHR